MISHKPFVVDIQGTTFRLDDWFRDKTMFGNDSPNIIVNFFEDMNGQYLVIRTPLFTYELMTVAEFIIRVESGRYEKIEKPKFVLGQMLKNKFTEETLEVRDVPQRVNDNGGEYVYYVQSYTPTFGYNYKSMSESEIHSFYATAGVVEL